MSAGTTSHSDTEAARNRKFGPLYSRNVRAVGARGLMATRSSNWMVMLSGFFEPVLYLIAMGVDVLQGYHVAKPMPAAEVECWIRDRTTVSDGGFESLPVAGRRLDP